MRIVLELLTLLIVLAAAAWTYFEPGFESLITLLVGLSALLVEIVTASKNDSRASTFSNIVKPFTKWKDQRLRVKEINTPIARTSFDTLNETDSVHHEIAIWHIWDDVSPTLEIELRHKIGNGSWSTVKIISGFSPKVWVQDVNGDNIPELLVQFHCGAHGQGLFIYSVSRWGNLHLLDGGEIYSNWSEISLEEVAGTYYVTAKQRDYSVNRDSMGPIIERYEINETNVRCITGC